MAPPAGFEPALPPPEAGTHCALVESLALYQRLWRVSGARNTRPWPVARATTRATSPPWFAGQRHKAQVLDNEHSIVLDHTVGASCECAERY